MKKEISYHCPVCQGEMKIARLQCKECNAVVDSELAIPLFFKLPDELQHFVLVFLRNRGSIRDVEKELGISYPTVCKKLDKVNEILKNTEPETLQLRILEQVEKGEISAKDAVKLLKEKG